MTWNDIQRMLRVKLGATEAPGAKHNTWHVYCGDAYVGRVLVSHGKGELTGREIGNIARSLKLNEHRLKDLERCTMSRDEFCVAVV